MRQMRNVFEAILKYGHDEDFVPRVDDEFESTNAPAGSKQKPAAMLSHLRKVMHFLQSEHGCRNAFHASLELQ